MKFKEYVSFLKESLEDDLRSIRTKQRGLKHIGYGKYKDNQGKIYIWDDTKSDYVESINKNDAKYTVIDVFGNGNHVEYLDHDRNLVFIKLKHGLVYKWIVYELFKVGEQVLRRSIDNSEKEHSYATLDDAELGVERQRKLEKIRKKNEKYEDIPKFWNIEAKKIAKKIIDNGIEIRQFSSSARSESKYMVVETGLKIRLSDHELPGHYEKSDINHYFGDNVIDFIKEVKDKIAERNRDE